MLTYKQKKNNYIKAVLFEKPETIPVTFHINDACWHHYDQNDLFDLMEAHSFLFPGYKRPEGVYVPEYDDVAKKDAPYTDDFGCVWQTTDDGIVGTVTGHPLESWDAFDSYRAPDPERCMGIGPVDWNKEKDIIEKKKENGECAIASLRHGHTFLQLCDLRGYQNLLFDMMDEDANLLKLIEIVYEFNAYIVDKYLEIGADQICYPEDLGMQKGPMISPELFERFIFPSYKKLMKKSQSLGKIVHMHSDGDIRLLVDYLMYGGVQVLNLQDQTNGIEWIKEKVKGRTCIELDIDRSFITKTGTPKEIDDYIRMVVSELGSRDGGLMMIYGLYPGIPIENVAALMDAFEKYLAYYS